MVSNYLAMGDVGQGDIWDNRTLLKGGSGDTTQDWLLCMLVLKTRVCYLY